MKNKKLFAILTLVCFMFTLMPVAAFAADATYTTTDLKFNATGTALASGVKLVSVDADNVVESGYKTLADVVSGNNYVAVSQAKAGSVVEDDEIITGAAILAAAAKISDANIDPQTSSFEAVDGDQTVKVDKTVKFDLALRNAAEYANAAGEVYIWAETANGTVTSALAGFDAQDEVKGLANVYSYTATEADEVLELSFTRSGEYTVYAAMPKPTADSVKDLNKFDCDFSKITVKTSAEDPDTYQATVTLPDANDNDKVDANETDTKAADSVFDVELSVTPNNVVSDKIFVNFYDKDGKPLKGETVAIETNSSAIEVNKETDTTNSQGEIDFKVSASVEGEYEVILTLDGVEWTLIVNVGNTAATYIETVTEPTNPQALYEKFDTDVIEFSITDINGNVVGANADGMDGIVANDKTGKYVVLTEAPADSDLESEDLKLTWNGTDKVWYLDGVGTMDAEGTYAVKVILDNGAYATAKWEVKKFQKPVRLVIGTSTDVIELGAAINGELLYFDANGVEKAATDVELAVTGYAVAKAEQDPNGSYTDNHNFKITVKDDEKYVGAVVTATAVSDKYDLVATKDFKVADGAVEIAFVDKSADVNVNNKLEWNVVNSEGTRVALVGAGAVESVSINYVVLDKPADAKVSVNNVDTGNDLLNKGIGKMSLTSNKVGNVTVQVIMKAKYETTADQVSQTKYYTGTQIIAVGTQGVGDVVVMSIGSNEIVINDAKATIDAAPIVENNRTFVPFRALAEAFGATVAYDEATQAVTAELNGVTVVMTIGSAEYTVNGVAKTADVAPFINGSRTMVPVRFAAEAFGIKVIPTYDENGATADILFNL